MRLEELDYELPDELIAQRPPTDRDGARLLVVDAERGHRHATIRDLPELLEPALWVVNDTRVIPARLHGHKPTGGAVELLLIEPLADDAGDELWRCMGRSSKPIKVGLAVTLAEGFVGHVEAKHEDGTLDVRFEHGGDFDGLLEEHGQMPLPPYVQRPADAADRERYQTIFADRPGAIAAPTAGLHFTDALVAALRERGHELAPVTLHVGPGTFRPVQVEELDEHPMHEERYEVPASTAAAIDAARSEGRAVVAVGTTVARTLESAAIGDGRVQVGPGRTRLFIKPPYEAKVVDHLLTNFHLPRSTLLALVMALGGEDTLRAAYAEAVRARYRFFSYGDAMLIRGRR
ncbi:MAG: tRNA preQ1(34) S-adenosylmethionine ribosyltransferase-isomerase QueA [Sandaracinus sp.]|nr:tRNA preQ1(34) S-adenosylmethionine ribosyltransferase-isomerase QueA [Sandaracinus sp.]